MKDKDLLKMLKKEFEDVVPPMSQRLKDQPIKSVKTSQQTTDNKTKQPFVRKWGFRLTAVACALVLVFVAVAVIIPTAGYNQYDTFVSLSINPEFSVVADSKGVVVNVTAVNRDAEVVMCSDGSDKLVGQDVNTVVSTLARWSMELGFTPSDNVVDISAVSVRGDKTSKKLCDNLSQSVDSALSEFSTITVNAIVESVEQLKEKVSVFVNDVSDNINELMQYMAERTSYFATLASQFVQAGFEQAKISLVYTVDLLETYIDLLEMRKQLLDELDEINTEIDHLDIGYWEGIIYTPVYDGWDLAQYAESNTLTEGEQKLLDQFNNQLEKMEKVGLATDSTGNFLQVRLYGALDFVSLRETLLEMEEFVLDIADTIASELQSLINFTVSTLMSGFTDEWESISSASSNVDSAESYVDSMTNLVRKEYNFRKNNQL